MSLSKLVGVHCFFPIQEPEPHRNDADPQQSSLKRQSHEKVCEMWDVSFGSQTIFKILKSPFIKRRFTKKGAPCVKPVFRI
jgi:hypothetical protein